jgi:RNA polymerase sigma factor for flagellar operon FliA
VPQPVSDDAADLFQRELPLIEGVIRFVVRRHRLPARDADEFASETRLRLIDQDYRILRRFTGRGSLRAYLTTVVEHLLLDYRTRLWGKWRPSAEARRAGPLGVRLDQLLHRDGLPLDQAIEVLLVTDRVEATRSELEQLGARLPRRAHRVFVGDEALSDVAAPADPADAALVAREAAGSAARTNAAVRVALGRLPPEDRLVVQLRFVDGLTVAEIARALHLDQKRLYRQIDRILATLRAWLEADGISTHVVQDLLEQLE